MRTAIALAGLMILAGCNHRDSGEQPGRHEGDHRKISENFQVGNFTKIDLGGSEDVIVTVGGAVSVRAEGDAEAIGRLQVNVAGDELHIGRKHHGMFNWGGGDHRGGVTVYVTVPSLTAASVSGSGDLKIDKVQADNFGGAVAGSGSIDIALLQARNVAFSIAGSGDVRAAGKAEQIALSIAGSGDIDVSGLDAATAKVSVMGSGDVRAKATQSAEINVMGSGDAVVTGGAQCKVNKMGSGNARCE